MEIRLLAPLIWMVPVLAVSWVAVHHFGRVRKDAAWKCMMIGVVAMSVGLIGQPLHLGLRAAMDDLGPIMPALVFIQMMTLLGNVLFPIGVALRALQSARTADRVKELELIIEVQNEQLSRQSS